MHAKVVFPFGLNDRIGDVYENEETHQVVCKSFPPLKKKIA